MTTRAYLFPWWSMSEMRSRKICCGPPIRIIPRDGVNVNVAVRLGVFSKLTLPGFAAATTDISRPPSITPSDLHTCRTYPLPAAYDVSKLVLSPVLKLVVCKYTDRNVCYFKYMAAMDIDSGLIWPCMPIIILLVSKWLVVRSQPQ
jgi:hypothetical protein